MRDRCSAHSFLQKVKRWHVLCRQWHPKATNTLTLEGRQSHRCTAKIHKIANYFSWALEATFFQHYSREFLTLWSFWGESTSILCCEKPFLSTCALGGVRFHLQPEQFWAVSTKGTAAGFCLLGVLVYEPHAYKDSLRKGTVVAFPFQDTFWFGSRPQDLTLHTDVVTLKKQLADVTLLALVLWVKSKGCVKAKTHTTLHVRTHLLGFLHTSPVQKLCTRRIENLHVRAAGGQTSGFVGNDSWGFEQETGGSTGQSDCHQAAPHHSTAPACTHAWPGYHGRAAGKRDGMWEMQNWNQETWRWQP